MSWSFGKVYPCDGWLTIRYFQIVDKPIQVFLLTSSHFRIKIKRSSRVKTNFVVEQPSEEENKFGIRWLSGDTTGGTKA